MHWALLDLRNPADIRIVNAEKDSCGLVDVSKSHKQEKSLFMSYVNTEIKEK